MKRLLACLLLLAAACKKEDKGDGSIANRAATGGQHECSITVAAKAPAAQPISGNATNKDEGAATEAAWAAACGKLPPPEQPACHDGNRYQSAIGAGRASPKNQDVTVTVTLTPAPPPQVTGKAASDESQAAACQAALLDACEKAGGQGDCVAAGTHDKRGEIAGSKGAP